jgi:hypothetical protein
MDADFDLQVAHLSELELLDESLHFECLVDGPLDGVNIGEFGVLIDSFQAACSHVRLTNRFDLLHTVLGTQLVESTEETIQQQHDLLVLGVDDLIETTNVTEEYGDLTLVLTEVELASYLLVDRWVHLSIRSRMNFGKRMASTSLIYCVSWFIELSSRKSCLSM